MPSFPRFAAALLLFSVEVYAIDPYSYAEPEPRNLQTSVSFYRNYIADPSYYTDTTNLDDPNFAQLYQKYLNNDYMTFDRYDSFKPEDPAYSIQNENKKINSIYDVSDCGDCIRGGFIYCTKMPLFGAEYSSS